MFPLIAPIAQTASKTRMKYMESMCLILDKAPISAMIRKNKKSRSKTAIWAISKNPTLTKDLGNEIILLNKSSFCWRGKKAPSGL